MSEEAPLTTTLKLPGANAPWLVVRSANAAQASAQLNEILNSGLGADLGRAQTALEAQFNAGHILDARPVDAPVNGGAFQQPQAAPQPVQQAAPVQQYQQPIQNAPEFVQQAAGQNYQPPQQQTAQQYAQAAANGYQQQQYQQPVPQQQYQQPQGSAPGAPLVNGQPAKLISGEKNGRKWQAWADPRSKSETEGMQRTDDPNHPGLAQGTHSLFKFIR